MAVVVSSDGKFKPFLQDHQVPKKVLAAYDWLDEDAKMDGWVKYKNEYLHLSDFERLSDSVLGRDWNGAHPDSFFSGTVIKMTDDGEEYKIGRFYQVDDDYKPKRGEKVYRDR
jgi:hypothetical protein